MGFELEYINSIIEKTHTNDSEMLDDLVLKLGFILELANINNEDLTTVYFFIDNNFKKENISEEMKDIIISRLIDLYKFPNDNVKKRIIWAFENSFSDTVTQFLRNELENLYKEKKNDMMIDIIGALEVHGIEKAFDIVDKIAIGDFSNASEYAQKSLRFHRDNIDKVKY